MNLHNCKNTAFKGILFAMILFWTKKKPFSIYDFWYMKKIVKFVHIYQSLEMAIRCWNVEMLF